MTLPQATGDFGAGWFYFAENRGAGTVTITPTTSTIDGAASLALTTNQGVLIVSDGTNYFTMRGIGGGGGGTPGGADTQVQFNDGGAFGGDAGLTYNKTTDALGLAGLLDLSGAAAGQIKFPATQNASANANTLDDYEEGSWTPVLGGTGGTSGQTYASQVARYIRIGKLVFVGGRVTLTAKGTITGNCQIQGLPFASDNVTDLFPVMLCPYFQNLGENVVTLGLYVDPNSTAGTFARLTAAGVSVSAMQTAGVTNTTDILFGGVYQAA